MKAYEVFEIEDFEHDKASNFAPDYGDTVSEGMVYLFVSLWIVIVSFLAIFLGFLDVERHFFWRLSIFGLFSSLISTFL